MMLRTSDEKQVSPAGKHTFHIPVMGTGYTVDTPIKVARYGVSSVISLVDDVLIEQVRRYHCERQGQPYEPITHYVRDARARRITEYLDLVQDLVTRQVEALRRAPFAPDSEISRYYELLPECPLKEAYRERLNTTDPDRKRELDQTLRAAVQPGSIDVNIMTKLDCDRYYHGKKLAAEFADAMAALRGYAQSKLQSAIVLSAGLNRRLYSYLAEFEDFMLDKAGQAKKSITLKVSDYRSALIQGKFLAKRGVWVSEYRIESGLNCGGHAFPTKGFLLGPILEEFKEKREQLRQLLFKAYRLAADRNGRPVPEVAPELTVTVQGGIGTPEEHRFLLDYYKVDSAGWATPFMLVPEAVNVDAEHLQKLKSATWDDVFLSDASPLNVPYWNLRSSSSEERRRQRIAAGKPGSPCRKGYLRVNTEFTEVPLCPAARVYQKRKLPHLDEEGYTYEQKKIVREKILSRACICDDLAGSATVAYGIEPDAPTAVCPGPNIVNFDRSFSLEEMVGHIYGRVALLANAGRSHMFLAELRLYVENLQHELELHSLDLSDRTSAYLTEFRENLLGGIEHYRELAEKYLDNKRLRFLDELNALKQELEGLNVVPAV